MYQSQDLSYQIRHIKETLRNIPEKGIGYGIYRYLVNEEKNTLSAMPQVCFNFLGEMDNNMVSDAFEIADLPVGSSWGLNSKRQYALHVNAIIVKNKLKVDIDYDGSIFTEAEMNKIGQAYTIRQLDELVEKYSDIGIATEIEDIYDATPMQRDFFLGTVSSHDPGFFYQCKTLQINVPLDLEVFKQCYDLIINKFDVLKTNFVFGPNEEVLQVVYKHLQRDVIFRDVTHVEPSKHEEFFEEVKYEDSRIGFRLENADSTRLYLIKYSESKYKLIWVNHHGILDGWSRFIIIKEFIKTYKELLKDRNYRPRPSHEFREYVQWIKRQDTNEADRFWRKEMEGYVKKPVNDYRPEPISDLTERVEVFAQMDEDGVAKINKILAEEKITINSLVNAIYGIVLLKMHNVDDIAFIVPAGGRDESVPSAISVVGMLMTLTPVRVNKQKCKTVREMAADVERVFHESQKYSYYLLKNNTPDIYDPNIWDSCSCYENYPIDNELLGMYAQGKISQFEAPDSGRVCVIFYAIPFEGDLKFKLSYNRSKIEDRNMQWFVDSMMEIIRMLNKKGDLDLLIDEINI